MTALRRWLWRIARWVLFRLDAESAHRATVSLIRVGGALGRVPLRLVAGGAPASPVRVLGLEFSSRVGLAAGFDKDAEIVHALPCLGFGFAEIGTVTPRPQPGNERPRLFRDVEQRSVFNRMGFNGLGATVVSSRLAAARSKLPSGFRVGVNVGKNKDTPNEEAAQDYARAATAFEGLADYLVVNVSSPNTPGLRSLQSADALRAIVGAVAEVIGRWRSRPPLLLKLAPELRDEALAEILEAGPAWGVDGWVLTNTWAGEWKTAQGATLPGGWSGERVREASRARLREARSRTRLPIVSVGGIMDAEEARARLSEGADLIQLYSGWIFGGPSFPVEIARALSRP